MFSAKWWLIVGLIGAVLAAKIWYPQGGDTVKSVFFGENQEIVAVFGGESWDD